MSKKLRTEVTVKGWIFPSLPGLVWHSGKFWLNDQPCKQVFNNGSISILYAGSKRSLKKLRQEAQPCMVTVMGGCPF
jgi:hypothetical protein